MAGSEFYQEYPDDAVKEQPTVTPKDKVEEKKEEVKETLKSKETPMEPLEEVARAQGWVSFEEWEGDPAEWRPADVFVERGKFFDTMSQQKKRIKQLTKQLDEMAQQIGSIRTQEYNRALEQLRIEKNAAIEDGDYQRVGDIDNKIDEVKQTQSDEVTKASELTKAQKQEILRDFVTENPWYAENEEMRRYADRMAAGYANVDGVGDVYDTLDSVVEEVKARFADSEYFRKPPVKPSSEYTESPSKVGASSTTGKSGSSKRGIKKVATAADLTPVQRQIGQRWVDNKVPGIENLDDYAKQLQDIGELNV